MGCLDPTGARQPGQTVRRLPDFGPNRWSNRSAVGFRSQKLTPASRVAGSHLQNPSNPNPTGATKKSSQICKNKPDPVRSRPNLERSRPDPAKPNNFYRKKKCIFKKKSSFRQEFSRFRQEFLVSDENSRFQRRFFQILMPFLISAIDPTWPTLTITENRTDRFFRQSVSGYSAPPPDAGGSSSG